MTVVSVKTGGGTEGDPLFRRVELSDGTLFSLKTVYLPPEYDVEMLFVPGRDLSGAEVESLHFAASCYRAERSALRLVARAEQCVSGLSAKLQARSFTASCVQAVLNRLCSLEVVSDERFALRWFRARLGRSGGPAPSPRGLVVALCRRGIPRETAQKALRSLLTPDAERLLVKRYLAGQGKTMPGEAPAEGWKGDSTRDRFLRHALRHAGFSPAILDAMQEEGEL
ncbi:MAG: RecX family transcriptional regulator [Treponema sp.]|jgi:regulatory protein|nr:RecX family transcriptional regulator [Treponema sp.]